MKRREFIRLLAASGLATAFPLGSPRSRAASLNGLDHYFISVSADGGWDATSLFDPKGTSNGVNNVEVDESRKVTLKDNQILRWSATPGDYSLHGDQLNNFFRTYSDRITFIRGVDTLTTSHVGGMKAAWSGYFGSHPMIGAMYAAIRGKGLPLSYVTFGGAYGGNDYTAGLNVTKARLNSDATLLKRLGAPSEGRHLSEVYAKVEELHMKRLQTQYEHEKDNGVSARAHKMERLLEERLAHNYFNTLNGHLNDITNDESFKPDWNSARALNLKNQARIAVSSLRAGVTSSVSLNTGGFDTHGFNDAQYVLLGDLVEGLHYLIKSLEYYDLSDRTTIMVSSDVGRTAWYNASGGKDHYPVSCQMIIHPQRSGLGNRVFGSSTDKFTFQDIDFNTGLPNSNGSKLTTRHTLYAVRELLGLSNTEAAKQFPLDVNIMPNLFGV